MRKLTSHGPLVAVASAAVAMFLMPRAALASEVPSAFFVSKSENKNEVHYGIKLDDRCLPSGGAPVFAYWRMRERGPSATAPLLAHERKAYGIASQQVRANTVRVVLRALARPVLFESRVDERGRCTVRVLATIQGRAARLHDVYVKLGFPFRVEYLLLQGHALDGGQWIQERVEK
jgi:hypothetical protein